jgi:hypothetical protein
VDLVDEYERLLRVTAIKKRKKHKQLLSQHYRKMEGHRANDYEYE